MPKASMKHTARDLIKTPVPASEYPCAIWDMEV
eukprot:CAMPEP_0175129692 /NCGR_PEP_ID=MMETSP0087-20121206/5609_1 /TAXON_ID=136419 /ORGANISM="Unknown Unknown, Strain D1" /LENGTH=32 /DNA_ID= /DNA_START= /DNA_END= /DNA_ORIENTATION=